MRPTCFRTSASLRAILITSGDGPYNFKITTVRQVESNFLSASGVCWENKFDPGTLHSVRSVLEVPGEKKKLSAAATCFGPFKKEKIKHESMK